MPVRLELELELELEQPGLAVEPVLQGLLGLQEPVQVEELVQAQVRLELELELQVLAQPEWLVR